MTDEATVPLARRIWNFPLVAMVVALVLVLTVIGGLTYAFAMGPADLVSRWGGAIPVLAMVAANFALYKLVLRRLGERKHDDLPFEGSGSWLLVGVVAGTALIALAVAAAAAAGVYRIVSWESGDDFATVFFQAGISAAFVEELIFRGILFRWIEEFAGSWAALFLTSLFFGLAHASNDGATVMSTVAIMFEAGILLGAAYMYARSLWLPIGIHFGWNFAQGYIFDVPVSGYPVEGLVVSRLDGPEWLSGGSFGLEASVLTLAICTGAGLWLLYLARRDGRVMAPRWRRRPPAASDEAVGVDVHADADALGKA